MTNGINMAALATAKSITAKCEIHGIDYQKHDFFGRGYQGVCPECAKEADQIKFDAEQKAIKAENEVRLNKLREDRVKLSGLPARFAWKTFSDYVPTTPDQEHALNVVAAYAKDTAKLNRGRGMIITGTVGVGKTHLAAAIINEIIKPDNSVNAIYITFSDMIRHIRSAWRDRSVDEQSLITKYASASMLIIDEIGVQFGSDSEMVQMFEVMNKRYGEMLPTVLISNLQMDELCKLLGDRIIDRMREDEGIAVRMDWESNRSAS